jgi:hypothetical protein
MKDEIEIRTKIDKYYQQIKEIRVMMKGTKIQYRLDMHINKVQKIQDRISELEWVLN